MKFLIDSGYTVNKMNIFTSLLMGCIKWAWHFSYFKNLILMLKDE